MNIFAIADSSENNTLSFPSVRSEHGCWSLPVAGAFFEKGTRLLVHGSIVLLGDQPHFVPSSVSDASGIPPFANCALPSSDLQSNHLPYTIKTGESPVAGTLVAVWNKELFIQGVFSQAAPRIVPTASDVLPPADADFESPRPTIPPAVQFHIVDRHSGGEFPVDATPEPILTGEVVPTVVEASSSSSKKAPKAQRRQRTETTVPPVATIPPAPTTRLSQPLLPTIPVSANDAGKIGGKLVGSGDLHF